jgi:XTP/dITP diphosphohydrolase
VTLITKENTLQVEGIVRGYINEREEGEGGFGYDPVFVPEEYDKTFASLPAEVKNSISHRARALDALKERLNG